MNGNERGTVARAGDRQQAAKIERAAVTDAKERSRIAAFELAEQGAAVVGAIDAAQLPSVSGRLAPDCACPVDYRIVGTHDSEGHPAIRVELAGTVTMICQRCLQPLSVAVDQSTLLLAAATDAELLALDEGEHEVILAKEPLDPVQLVEDELLLTLPFAPKHALGVCEAASTSDDAALARSPFERLAALKNRRV